ncbi:hypothetical protein ZEAMMB73_Zm00001d049917 [Zea mays]|uniref:Uncharacterized protein n=1 Tax=Zea mays TaxID=4577 RepID=A0A1D6PYQ4_MAIZE|nr:hypothetical protein ZEAMMB73_Zm00001d049917 [Zea mays]
MTDSPCTRVNERRSARDCDCGRGSRLGRKNRAKAGKTNGTSDDGENDVVSLQHCNHQYHVDFDICHDLHGLIIEEHVPHLPVEVPSYIVSHQNNPIVVGVGDDHEVPLFEDGQRGAAALDRV